MVGITGVNDRNKIRIVLGVLFGAFLAALDTTILATVMPTIVGDLGGLSLYSWVFSIYMIMAAVSMPLWGKMSDMFGRRRLFVASVVMFLSGSFLCGFSQSMIQLIVFRGLQGIGAGGLSSIPFALISTVFPPRERGRAIGFISSVWGISSVLGPLAGSFIAMNMSWRWVFYVNIPVGVIAVFLVARYYRDLLPLHREKIDYAGGASLTMAIVSLLMLCLKIGTPGVAWMESAVYLVVFVSLAVLFVVSERRAKNPILHIEFFNRRPFWLGNLLGFLSSFTMYAIIAFMPLFSQSVQGGTALQAGLVITPMSLAWSLSSVVAGRLTHRFGERNLIRTGTVIMLGGFLLATLIGVESPVVFLIACVALCGVGMGCQTPALLLTVQNSLEMSHLGVATSSQMLARTIGGAVGVSVLGAVLAGSMMRQFLSAATGGLSGGYFKAHLAEPQELLSAHARSSMSREELAFVLRVFTDGLHAIFLIGLAIIVCTVLLTFFLPESGKYPSPERSANQDPIEI